MSGHRKWSELRDQLARPGAEEAVARARKESLEEIRLYELRRAEAVSQVELAGRLEVTQGAISKFEHADDVRVSTLREYLDALGARLELVAVFDDEERRVPVYLGATCAESSTGSSTGSLQTRPDTAARASTRKSRKPSSAASPTHNPKVAGSNPAPATNCPGQRPSRREGLAASGPATGPLPAALSSSPMRRAKRSAASRCIPGSTC